MKCQTVSIIITGYVVSPFVTKEKEEENDDDDVNSMLLDFMKLGFVLLRNSKRYATLSILSPRNQEDF